MSTNLDDFLPYVLPYAQGASEPTAINTLRDAAIEYCQKTCLWRDWLDPADVTIGEDVMTFSLPADSELYRVEELWLNRHVLDPLTEDGLRYSRFQPGDMGSPVFYTSDAPGSIRLVPIPNQTFPQALVARVTLMPSRTSTTLPDFLFKHYAREIADGALSRLHSSSEAYAVPGKVGLYQPKFAAAIDRGASQAARSNVKARRRARASFL